MQLARDCTEARSFAFAPDRGLTHSPSQSVALRVFLVRPLTCITAAEIFTFSDRDLFNQHRVVVNNKMNLRSAAIYIRLTDRPNRINRERTTVRAPGLQR